MRVLVVKLSSLGDVLHTLPALTDACAALPGIRFDWAVEEAFAEVPPWHPAVDRVIPVALRRWRKRPLRDFRGPEWRLARAALRRQHYDAVIDAQGLMKSAFIARLIKAPRYGLDRHSARERLASSVYHHGINVPRELHAVERIRLLFARALNYPLSHEQGNYDLRKSLTAPHSDSPPGLLFFHGTAQVRKLWPVSHWVELAELALSSGYNLWLPWGDAAECERAQKIAAACNNTAEYKIQVLPSLNLSGLASLLLEVRGAVAVDTGLGHLAAALDVPTVSLYGPTRPGLIGTYGNNQVHISAKSFVDTAAGTAQLMPAIPALAVWQALQKTLQQSLQQTRQQPTASVQSTNRTVAEGG